MFAVLCTVKTTISIAIVMALQLHAAAAFSVLSPAAFIQTRPILQHTSFSTVALNNRKFIPTPQRYHKFIPATERRTSTILKGLFDDEEEDPEKQIPPELRDEIYRAEANTPAAQGRQQRIFAYVFLTFAGVTTAFFNAFLSDLRFGDGAPSTDLAYYGFGWVQENFLFSFLLMNKIGGAIGLLGAGLSGTLAEVEVRDEHI